MSVNKVTAFGENLIDLTEDTVTKDTLIKGVTAHDARGNSVTGTFDTDKYLEKAGDASNTTAVFSASKERANISTGEKLSVIFGKIAKFFSDLKTVAFTGNYSDLSGTPSVVSKTTDGLCPKNGGTTTKFLRDDGTYAVPTSSAIGLSTLEQVTAAATAGNVTAPVGAGALAEVNSSLVSDIYVGDDKKLHKIIGGADTVLNFSNGFSSFGQGEYKYGTLTTSLIVTANQDYDRALMIVSGANINMSSCSTSGSGNINLIEQNVPNLQIFAFTLENIKHGDAITILSKTQARFNYSILC